MGYRCRNPTCDHEHEKSCNEQGAVPSIDVLCCECGSTMYKSEVHTPASGCSAGTGMVSLGPAASVRSGADDFDKQLKQRLEAFVEAPATGHGKLAAEQAARKVSNWKQKIASLLDGDDGAGMADPFTTDDPPQPQLSDDESELSSIGSGSLVDGLDDLEAAGPEHGSMEDLGSAGIQGHAQGI